ncbi:MAG TPA: hypothetical protein VIO12_01460, partial [Thermoanaerobaculia bacterium]
MRRNRVDSHGFAVGRNHPSHATTFRIRVERLDPIWTTARNSRRKRNPESINRVISKVERDQDRLVTRRSHERGAGGIARRRNVQS